MTTHTPKRAPRIITGIVLASCAVAAPLLGASAAYAGGEGASHAAVPSIVKTDPNGTPLSGAVFTICSPEAVGEPIPGGGGVYDYFQGLSLPEERDDYLESAENASQETQIANAQERVDAEQAGFDEAQAAFDAVAADLLTDEQREAAQADIDAYAPIAEEQATLDAQAASDTEAWQVVAQQVLDLIDAGETVPAELAAEEAALQAVAESSAQAASDFRDAHATEREAAQTAEDALARDAVAQEAQTTLANFRVALDNALDVLDRAQNSYDSRLYDLWTNLASKLDDQIDRNTAAGITLDSTHVDGLVCYDAVTGKDGVASAPVSSIFNFTVEEKTAPEGYVGVEGVLSPGDVLVSNGDYDYGAGANGGASETFTLVNEEAPEQPEEPEEPTVPEEPEEPVDPEEPEVPTTPETPTTPKTPTGTLAYTGGDTTGAAWAAGIAATALAAGAALLGLRRRTRDAD